MNSLVSLLRLAILDARAASWCSSRRTFLAACEHTFTWCWDLRKGPLVCSQCCSFFFTFVNFHLAHFHLSTGTVASPRQVTPLPCPPCTLSVSLPTTTTNCFTVTLYNWLEHVFRTLIHHHRRHSCWKLLTWADYSRWSSWTKSWADLNANRIFFRSHHYF